jgi:hypothetical protein
MEAIKACPFDGSLKFRQVGIESSNAQECLKCHHILVLRPREEGSFHEYAIFAYTDAMRAASAWPIEFQISMF